MKPEELLCKIYALYIAGVIKLNPFFSNEQLEAADDLISQAAKYLGEGSENQNK